jgi:hypothetical protein
MPTTTWQGKANKIIAELCTESYRQANMLGDGRLRKKHVPYRVPRVAEELVACLKTGDEMTAKAIFMQLALVPQSAMEVA